MLITKHINIIPIFISPATVCVSMGVHANKKMLFTARKRDSITPIVKTSLFFNWFIAFPKDWVICVLPASFGLFSSHRTRMTKKASVAKVIETTIGAKIP
jgi:hypothetical protein